MSKSSSSSSSSSSDKNNDNSTKNQARSEIIKDPTKFPIEDSERTCTDFCCVIIGIGFTLLIIIIGACVFDYQKYVKSNFPTDSDGNLCGVDFPAYPFLYFAHPPEISRRVCVTKCPQKGDKALDCKMTSEVGCRFSQTPGFQVVYYESSSEKNRIGMFCLPSDPTLQQQVLKSSNLSQKNLFINSLDAILLSFYIGLGISLIYMLFTQCFPKQMNLVGSLGGIIVIAVFSILLLLYKTHGPFQMPVGICFLVIAVILFITYIIYKKTFQIQAIFLNRASSMLKSRPLVFLYIPLFMVFLVLFIILLVFQFSAIWGGGHLVFLKDQSIFYIFKSGGAVAGTIFLAIQALWGLSFLKEAFNFCVSGNAVIQYYDSKNYSTSPFKNLWCKHLGSVIGCAFITGFFTLGDFFFDLIKPSYSDEQSCKARCFATSCCRFFQKLFDLVRSDSMAYVNLTGNSYCNSARYCEYLCDQSRILQFSQSCSRTYRFGAHMLISGIVGIIALYLKGTIAPFAVFIIVVMTIFVCTFFISIHADAAEAILILFLAEEELGKRKNQEKDHKSNFNRFNFTDFKEVKFDLQNDLKNEIMEVIQKDDNLVGIWKE